MRLVHHASELSLALSGAPREALSAFGDGTLMLERLILNGRHIEIQVFADAHGRWSHRRRRTRPCVFIHARGRAVYVAAPVALRCTALALHRRR